MTILLEKETQLDIGLDYEGIATDVVAASLAYVDCPYECVVNILLTDNAGIRSYNRKLRNMDKPTDVLSFPGIDFEKEGVFDVVEQSPASYFDSESGELMIGDILISLEMVAFQAEQYNHSPKREFAFLMAHSMLHLSGYDHMEEKERLVMEQMQEEILQSIGYSRDVE